MTTGQSTAWSSAGQAVSKLESEANSPLSSKKLPCAARVSSKSRVAGRVLMNRQELCWRPARHSLHSCLLRWTLPSASPSLLFLVIVFFSPLPLRKAAGVKASCHQQEGSQSFAQFCNRVHSKRSFRMRFPPGKISVAGSTTPGELQSGSGK